MFVWMEPSIDKPQINPSKYNKFDFILYLTKKRGPETAAWQAQKLTFSFLIFSYSKSIVFWQEKHGKKVRSTYNKQIV